MGLDLIFVDSENSSFLNIFYNGSSAKISDAPEIDLEFRWSALNELEFTLSGWSPAEGSSIIVNTLYSAGLPKVYAGDTVESELFVSP